MKTKYIFLSFLMVANFLQAQQCRYSNRIFSNISKQANVVYTTAPGIPSIYISESSTSNQSMAMDIFTPNADTATKRALIIFAHPGGFINGSKNTDDMQGLCDSFAHRGFVTATIDYRVNFNLFSSNSSERAVWRGTQDASAAVRFFKSKAALYKIDTSKIFFWGSSAGAFMALNLAYLDDAERPASTLTAPDLKCKDCSGTATTNTSKVAGIISCWGAIKDTNWMKNNNVPLIMFHGSADNVVNFNQGSPFSLATLPSVTGSNQINKVLNRTSIPHSFYWLTGGSHEYWGTSNGTFAGSGPTIYWQDIINKADSFIVATMGLPTVCSTTLPIDNVVCKASFIDEKVVQITANLESNNNASYSYEIEFSNDLKNWVSINKLNGGNLQYNHTINALDKLFFYRIKQSNNNQILYSNIAQATKTIINKNVEIYPNPAKNFIQILSPNIKQIIVYNAVSKEVLQNNYVASNSISINVTGLQNGLHFIKIVDANGKSLVQKFVVEK
jgi:poly(3-hydroxybutyrate) depolymerase